MGNVEKRLLCLILCAALLCCLWGCTGRELYERLLIHGIGIDPDDSGTGFRVTVRSSTSPEDEGEEYFQCSGATVPEALGSLSRSTGRQPFYAHNYLVVFGKECAEQGLDRCLDFFVRYYNTRPAVRLYLAEDRAEDVLSFQKDGKYLKMSELQQLGDSSPETGRAVRVEILDFVNSLRRPGSSPVMPVLRAGEDKVEVVSTACFEGYRLKAFLTPEETRGYLAVKGRLKKGEAVVRGDFGTATLSLSGGSGKVETAAGEDGLPRFGIRVEVQAGISSMAGDWTRPDSETCRQMERALERELEGEIRSALAAAIGENHCDIFGFGAGLYRQDPSRWAELEKDWPELMARCQYPVTVTARIERLE